MAAKHDDLSSGKMKPDGDMEMGSHSKLGCLGIQEEARLNLEKGNGKLENVAAPSYKAVSPTFFEMVIPLPESHRENLLSHR